VWGVWWLWCGVVWWWWYGVCVVCVCMMWCGVVRCDVGSVVAVVWCGGGGGGMVSVWCVCDVVWCGVV